MSNKILVVDDNKFVRDLISFVLDNGGYQVEVFSRAAGVLEHIEASHPRLVILDVSLPDGDGRDLCRQIKESAAVHHIPVIVCSGQANIRECLKQQGAPDAVLPKPFDMNQLIDAVQQRLAQAA